MPRPDPPLGVGPDRERGARQVPHPPARSAPARRCRPPDRRPRRSQSVPRRTRRRWLWARWGPRGRVVARMGSRARTKTAKSERRRKRLAVRARPLYVQLSMRLGIFSDIHANLEALSAVLEAYRSERIDTYYCLGDTVGYGGSPNECADLVRETARKTILGNHDAAVSGRMDYSYYYEAARHALDAHAAMLSEANMTWLKSLPYEEKLDDSNVLLCHGSPVRLEEFEYIFAPEQ